MSLDAYYYGFFPTGVGAVDDILAAVAAAGKAFHHTEFWSDPMVDDYRCIRAGQTPAEAIEEAAKKAADEIERLRDALRSIANIDDPENDAWAALDMAFQALEARP